MNLGHLLMIPGLRSQAAAPLQVLASVGTSLTSTTGGNKAITGVGFQPKVVMPFTALQPVSQSTSGGNVTIGASTATGSGNVSISSQSGLAASNTRRRQSNVCLSALASDGTLYTEASLASLDVNGFTLNYTSIQLTEMILNHICLGGSSLEVSYTQQTMNSTNAPQSFAHGLSGPPTGVIAFSVGIGSVPNQAAVALLTYGMWAGGPQRSVNLYSDFNVTTTNAKKYISTDFLAMGGASILRAIRIDSVDSTNINTTYTVANSTAAIIFGMLAFRGAKSQVGDFDCNGSLDPLTIATPGIVPKLFLGFALAECVDNINTARDHINFSIFASDGTNNVSCGMTDLSGVTTTTTYRHQLSTALQEVTAVDGTQRFSANASFSGQSVLLDPTVNQGISWGQGAYIVVGA